MVHFEIDIGYLNEEAINAIKSETDISISFNKDSPFKIQTTKVIIDNLIRNIKIYKELYGESIPKTKGLETKNKELVTKNKELEAKIVELEGKLDETEDDIDKEVIN